MSALNIIRAWKDPDYRRSLTAEQRARLPAHPSEDNTFEVQAHVDGICCPLTKKPCQTCVHCHAYAPPASYDPYLHDAPPISSVGERWTGPARLRSNPKQSNSERSNTCPRSTSSEPGRTRTIGAA